MAAELGFDVSHLYLRPVPFETANQRSVFVTTALEDGSSVDRHVEPREQSNRGKMNTGNRGNQIMFTLIHVFNNDFTNWKIMNQSNFARWT